MAKEPEIVGVIGLAGVGDEARAASLATEVQKALQTKPGIQVLHPEETLRRLGGGFIGQEADFERLRGLFQKGHLQSYSFEYQAAVATLDEVLAGLDRLPPSQARWELFIQACIFRGIALLGMRNEENALRSFAAVLRTRRDFQLDRDEYSSRTIDSWEKARRRLASLGRGKVAVESEPPQASVFIDGLEVGKTPYIGEFHHGRYHLQVRHPEAGSVVRWFVIGPELARFRFQLNFEGSLDLDRPIPVVRYPGSSMELPPHWWPWLGARLSLQRLVAVFWKQDSGRTLLAASLMDLERARPLREGWLEPTGQLEKDVSDLVDFLVTGQATPRVRVAPVPPAEGPQSNSDLVPPLPVTFLPRPWYRRWWPYTIASGGLLAGAIGSHLASAYHRRLSEDLLTENDIRRQQEISDAWLGTAIACYVLSGAAFFTGLVLDLTYRPEEASGRLRLAPAVDGTSFGVVVVGRF